MEIAWFFRLHKCHTPPPCPVWSWQPLVCSCPWISCCPVKHLPSEAHSHCCRELGWNSVVSVGGAVLVDRKDDRYRTCHQMVYVEASEA